MNRHGRCGELLHIVTHGRVSPVPGRTTATEAAAAALAARGQLWSSAGAKAVLAALDQNTQGLGAAIGSVYGAAAQKQFLKLWRAHIGFFVNYTLGVATHNSEMVATAQHDLNGYISQFSAFIADATKLPASAVAADLKGHVSTPETAINAIVARRPSEWASSRPPPGFRRT
jgi:hypothetical protein